MRNFTKGIFMALVAVAMSTGAMAQVALDDWISETDKFEGYFRVINVGYLNARGTGVMNVTSPSSVMPQAKQIDAVTMPGTVMYIKAEVESGHVPNPQSDYNDYKEGDFVVKHLRSQAVDVSAGVYNMMARIMKEGFEGSLKIMNRDYGWNLTDDELKGAINDMFFFMKMYLERTEDAQGQPAFYLKSTTPDTRPLANLLKEKNIEVPSGTRKDTEWLWDELFDNVRNYCDEYDQYQLWTEWDYFFDYELSGYTNRIHMGHTYYIIGGHVQTNLNTRKQKFDMGPVHGEFISFANENKVNYPFTDYIPEIDVAGEFSKWYLEPIYPGNKTLATNFFGIKGSLPGLDGHYYSTIYVDFPMQIVQNGSSVEKGGKTVRVWGIEQGPKLKSFESVKPNSGDIIGYAVTKEYKDIVPARTPVVVECSSPSFFDNLLQPCGDPVETNLEDAIKEETERSFLKGIFFASDFDYNNRFVYHIRPTDDGTQVSKKVFRVFNSGRNVENPLGFFKYSGKVVKPNQAFMILDESDAYVSSIRIVDEDFLLGISEVTTEKTDNATIYDIQGRRVSNPVKGLYIVNGRKMVVK